MRFPASLEHCGILRVAAGLAVSALVAACVAPGGPQGPLHWAKLGASYDQFMGDHNDCVQRARYVDTGGGVLQAQPVPKLSLFKACMEARGWYVNQAGYAPPDSIRME